MNRRRFFNLAAGVSAAMFVLTCIVGYLNLQTHVNEGDRLREQLAQIDADLAREPWTPEYKEHAHRRDAPAKALAAYQLREPDIRASEYRRYVLLPCAMLIGLAILPTGWILLAYVRWERRLAARAGVPPTRLQRAWRALTALLAAGSFALALLTSVIWARSYWVADRFYFSTFFDEQDLTFWRQTSFYTGNGSFGVDPMWQSGPKGAFRQTIQQMYQRTNRNLDTIPMHRTAAPGPPDFRFGPPSWTRWGFTYGYFEHGRAAHRPARYAHELIAPIWPVEILFLIVPAFWFWRWNIRRRSIRIGCCARCGYDLTGNTSGICPECGSSVAPATASPAPLI